MAKMPWAKPACHGSRWMLSETKVSTAAKPYQSAARKISAITASARMPHCQWVIRARCASVIVSKDVDIGFPFPQGFDLRTVAQPHCPELLHYCSKFRRRPPPSFWRQEIDLVFSRDAYHLRRIGEIVQLLEQGAQSTSRSDPEQTSHVARSVVVEAVGLSPRQPDQITRAGMRFLIAEFKIESAFDHVDELVLGRMDVRRHERAGR